jgi:glycine cleavage system H protein
VPENTGPDAAEAAQVWQGCAVPRELLYDVDMHVWVRVDGETAVLGMTDVAQTMGGRVVSISWKKTGRRYDRGRSLAVIESAKWVGPFPAPLTGELLEVNSAAFDADIAIANRDPYGAGWLARLRPSEAGSELGLLADGATAFARYRALIEERGIRCYRCAE